MYDSRKADRILALVLALSVGTHVAVWLALRALPTLDQMIAVLRIQDVSLVEEPLPPPEPEPEPVLEEEPEPEPEVAPPVRRERPDVPPPPDLPPDEPPPPAEEQIEDFTGETLTNDSGEAWQSAVGNGQAMDTPIGGPTGTVTGRHREGVEGGQIGGTGTEPGTQLVALHDLSSRPSAPSQERLAELIRTLYPADLRRLSIEGSASVRLRVGADGRVSRVRMRSESHEGFGQACVHVLQEAGVWGQPRDRDGNAVATEVNFDCNFLLRL